MSTHRGTDGRTWRTPLPARAPAGAFGATRLTTLLLAAILAVTLALAPRAEAYVYWADEDIKRANLDGSGAQTLISEASAHNGLAVDDAHIYWGAGLNPAGVADANAIARANLDGTGVDYSFITFTEPVTPLGPALPAEVAVDDEHVYWASLDTGAIGRANLDGSGVDDSFISAASSPLGVAVDDQHVYWGAGEGIGRANLDGSGVDHSFLPANAYFGIAVDAAHIYWGTSDGIGRANLDGSGVDPTFISRVGGPFDAATAYGVAVDATHIYWTVPALASVIRVTASEGESTGAVWRANLDGSGVECLITGLSPGPGDVAVDALGPPPSDPPGCEPPPQPSNEFSFGKVKKNKQKGTAKLTVKNLSDPGVLELAKTKKVTGKEKTADASKEKLPIKPKGKAKKKLNTKGKAKVKAKVTYTPDGGEANTKTKKVKLKKR